MWGRSEGEKGRMVSKDGSLVIELDTLFKIVVIDPFDPVGSHGRHAHVVLDHQVGDLHHGSDASP